MRVPRDQRIARGRERKTEDEMKSFLVPVENHRLMVATLSTAALLARRLGAHIEGVALHPPTDSAVEIAAAMASVPIDEQAYSSQSRRLFDDFCVAAQDPTRNCGLSYGWLQDRLVPDSLVGVYGRVFDLIVVGKPGCGEGEPRWATFRSALLDSGRPVLVCGNARVDCIAERIALLDDGSVNAARTVALADRILREADQVTILPIKPPAVQTADQLVATLTRNGIKAECMRSRDRCERNVLATIRDLRCDLILRGGYGRAYFVDGLLGRCTDFVLANTDVPVLIAQ
jgi:nucleotide-binding universal stress UspA family protein